MVVRFISKGLLMAEKFYFGDDADKNSEQDLRVYKDVADLRRILLNCSLMAEVEDKGSYAIVRVSPHAGSSEYFARGGGDTWWLQRQAYKTESRGGYSLYYLKYQRE